MIFLLKLLRKIIGLCVKLVLLPFRLVMRLVGLRSGGDGGSSSAAGVASAAASASATAAAGAAGAAESRREESTGTDTGAPRRVDVATWTNYERFRKALYAYAGLGVLFYVFLWAEFGPAGDLPLFPMAVGSVVPAAIGYATRTRTRLAWGAGMAYAGLFLLVSVVSLGTLSTLGPSASRAFRDVLGGGVIMLLGVVSLLQIAALGAALYFGATGRAVALGGGSVEPSPAETTAAPADSGADTSASGSSEPAAPSDSTDGGVAATDASDAAAPTGTDASGDAGTTTADTAAAGASTTTATDSGGGAAPASGAAAATDAPADDPADEAPGGDGSDVEPDTDTGADPAPEQVGPSVVDLAERARSTHDPAVVRDLGEQAGDDIPTEVVAALEACAEADDPDVRVAVCEACAAIDADETDAVLRQLRIDTNDRVATAAMAAY